MSRIAVVLLFTCALAGLVLGANDPNKKALFYRTELDDLEAAPSEDAIRSSRQTDQTVRSLLEWIQGQYSGGKKKTRQSEPSREYLPAGPSNPVPQEKPRPFSSQPTLPTGTAATGEDNGYPYENPEPSFPLPTGPEFSPTEETGEEFGEDETLSPGVETDSPPEEDESGRLSSRPQPFPSNPPQTGFPSPKPKPKPTPAVPLPPVSQQPGESVVIGEGSTDQGSSAHAHPPHIHAMEVQCGKEQMTINIEFDREFEGVIYSKGFFTNRPNRRIATPDGKSFYNDASCRYVEPNSGKKKFSFTVSLNSCGTQFVDQFKSGGQAYLENVLVMQNEPGIQEVWDTIRRVRCLWEGSINKAVSASLELDMLNQEIVTFSGDTATARLDIQMGRGPFAPLANGLVKIGETMTLVISVRGDAGFDIQVKDCVARDSSSTNEVRLTDEQGCVLRPKLMGAFQKTRETGNTGATILAYAFFQAFKFPEIMDMTLDCNVELCKTDCEACPTPGQSVEPAARRRRSVDNTTLGEPVRIHRTFQIVSAEDFADSILSQEATAIFEKAELTQAPPPSICMSVPGFLLVSSLLISLLIGSSITSVLLWFKSRNVSKCVP